MATQGIVKSEFVAASTHKVEVNSTVKEISHAEKTITSVANSKPVEQLDARIICKLPPAPKFEAPRQKIFKEFECEYPSVDPNVERVRLPLPFPDTLEETIGWADAFIDRVASATRARKEENLKNLKLLADRIKALDAKLATTEVQLEESRCDAATAREETEKVRKELATAKADAKATIAARDAKIKEQDACIHRLEDCEKALLAKAKALENKLAVAEKTIENLLCKLHELDHKAAAALEKEHAEHMADHAALAKEHSLLEAETKAKEAALKSLAETQEELRKTKINLEAEKKKVKDLEARLKETHTKLHTALDNNSDLRKEKAALELKLKGKDHDIKELQKDVAEKTEEICAAKSAICDLEKKLKEAADANAVLKDEIKKITAEKDASAAKIKDLEHKLSDAAHTIGDLKHERDDARHETEHVRTELNGEVNKWKAKYEDVYEQYKIALADEEKAENKIAHVKADLAHAREEVAEAEKELAEERANIAKKVKVALAASSINPEEVEKLKADLAATQKKLIPQTPGKRVTILTVEYGTRAYTPKEYPQLFEKLQTLAEAGGSFKVENSFFAKTTGEDPLKGETKSYSITYQLDGAGYPIHLYGKEHGTATFKLTH